MTRDIIRKSANIELMLNLKFFNIHFHCESYHILNWLLYSSKIPNFLKELALNMLLVQKIAAISVYFI